MRSFTARPRSPALRSLVKSFHYHETDLPFTLERIMPNGQAHLLVNLSEDKFRTYDLARAEGVCPNSGVVLTGPHAKPVIIDTRAQRWLAAVEFRHGGASCFFSIPMAEASNRVLQLQDVWQSDGRVLRERLQEAPTPALKFQVFEEVLLDHLGAELNPGIQHAITALRAGFSVLHVASRLGLSLRTLQRRFSAQVGMTPKRFARVHRLQRLLRAVRQSAKPDWCILAVEHGYTDQAHLIHDFRDLADITPSEYKPHSLQRSNHVPLLEHVTLSYNTNR